MAILGDYHTHTVFSHGKGTIEENVLAAIELGLKEIAITDHGFAHVTYHVRRYDWPYIKAEAARMRKKYPMIRIYLGLETNLLDTKGRIDLKDEDIEELDIVICGYHKYVRSGSLKEFWRFKAPNFIGDLTGKSSVKTMVRNTDAYLKMLENYDIDIISHPNYGIDTDVVEIAKAAKAFGTYMELNGKRVSMTIEELQKVAATGANFIVDSDAHSPSRVGEISVPLSFIEKAGIPPAQLANWDKLPVFRSRLRKGL